MRAPSLSRASSLSQARSDAVDGSPPSALAHVFEQRETVLVLTRGTILLPLDGIGAFVRLPGQRGLLLRQVATYGGAR